MTTNRKLLAALFLCIAALVTGSVMLFRLRFYRTLVLRDLSVTNTQTASVAFNPSNIRWTISGQVQGSGVVVVPGIFSNSVSGQFSTSGTGDYYATNVSLIFIPQGKASGEVRGEFFLSDGLWGEISLRLR